MAAAVCSSYKRVNGQRPLYVYKRPFVYVTYIPSMGKSKAEAPGQKRSPPSLLVHLEISTDSSLGPGPDDESAETSKCTSRGREISSKRYCPGLSRIDPLNRRTTPRDVRTHQ